MTDEGGVAGGWELEVEIEMLDGVGEGLEALVAANDAEGGGGLGSDVEFDAGPALAGGLEGAAGEFVGASILEFGAGIGGGGGAGGFEEFGGLVGDELLDGDDIGSALTDFG